jgi:transposase
MRGHDIPQTSLFSFVDMEKRVPAQHPLRKIRPMVDRGLLQLEPRLSAMYSPVGRVSIAPEKLIRALLIQILYSVRSERQLVEQLDYNILFRWFVGLGMDDQVWNHSTFSKNRDRLLEADLCQHLLRAVYDQAIAAGLVSDEHFSVDGTLLDAWASQKSFKPKDGSGGNDPNDGGGRNAEVDFHGKSRKNDTHGSVTDPEARLMRKGPGKEAKLCYAGHLIIENRNGLVADVVVTQATGNAERDGAITLVSDLPGAHRKTIGADKAYDRADLVTAMRDMGNTLRPAQKKSGSAIDGRTTRHPGYAISQTIRKRVEEPFGWGKTIGQLRKLHHRGVELVDSVFALTMTAFDLVRMKNLMPDPKAS